MDRLRCGRANKGTEIDGEDPGVIVQLLSNDGGVCFESTFSMPATTNEVEQFKDKH